MQTNYFSPLSFEVVIQRLPNTEFFTQRFLLPAVFSQPVQRNTPIGAVFDTPDRLTYGEFDLGFILDENMNNYLEIYGWMKGIGFPENTEQYQAVAASQAGTVSDITVILNNSHKNANKKVVFKDCFPIGLSSISLDVRGTDIQYPEATATFRYDYFDIE